MVIALRAERLLAEPKLAPPGTVGVVFPACVQEPFPFDAALGAMRIELAQEGVEQVERRAGLSTSDKASIEILVECGEGVSSLVIRVHDPRTRSVERTMELSDLPPALRPRGLALATAELARSVWSRPPAAAYPPEPRPPPESLPEKPPPQPVASKPAPPPPTRPIPSPREVTALPVPRPRRRTPAPVARWLELFGSLGARIFVPDVTPLFGPRAGIRLGRLRLGLEALAGQRRDRLGQVWLVAAAGSVGLEAWALSTPTWRLHAGPRGSLGLALGKAEAEIGSRAGSARETYLDLGLEIGAEPRLNENWSGLFEIEAGWARGLSARADHREAGTIGGWLVGARLGCSVAP